MLKLLICQLLSLAHCPPPETSQDTSQTVEVREEGNSRIKGIARLVNRMWHRGSGAGLWTDLEDRIEARL